MYLHELAAMVIYFLILLMIGFLSFRKNTTAGDFIMGGRSLNYWLTALAAHASDMSSWLFLGYPSTIYNEGLFGVWTAIGLIVCMYLNWQLIAPKIRVATEQYDSYTFSAFFENRLVDTSGLIRLFTALILVVFYTIYISAFLKGMGDLLSSLFGLNYSLAILIGILIVIPYVFTGGYRTLAWIDLFQGSFLMCVILLIPLYLIKGVGGFAGVSESFTAHHLAKNLLPDLSGTTVVSIISMAFGWGLGYFGQPHIVTKFMGIKNVSEIPKSKWIGMSWMVLALAGATLVGAIGVPFFEQPLADPEQVFIKMVRLSFSPFVVGFILCAILGATINAMSSQVLVMTTSLAEDFYKRMFRPLAKDREILLVSRLGVIFSGAVAFVIALGKTTTIYGLVQYAWSGIGSSFGPLVLLSLYSNRVNKYGAWAGILGGGITSAVWPLINDLFKPEIAPLIPGFFVSCLLILIVSRITEKRSSPA